MNEWMKVSTLSKKIISKQRQTLTKGKTPMLPQSILQIINTDHYTLHKVNIRSVRPTKFRTLENEFKHKGSKKGNTLIWGDCFYHHSHWKIT